MELELINCAIIENDTVVNIIVAETLERAIEIFGGEIIAITDSTPQIGWTRTDGVWSAPVEEPTE